MQLVGLVQQESWEHSWQFLLCMTQWWRDIINIYLFIFIYFCPIREIIFAPFTKGMKRQQWFIGNLRDDTCRARQLFSGPEDATEIGLPTKCKGLRFSLTNSISHPIPGGHFNNATWQGFLAKQNAIFLPTLLGIFQKAASFE